MRTPAIVLLLAVIAPLPAQAFRPRPISDLRFEHRLEQAHTRAAASDGDDYLVVVQYGFGTEVYAQILSNGMPYGPSVLIGWGSADDVVWTGSQYLVVWRNQQGVLVTGVSRRGAVRSTPRLVIAGDYLSARAATNGRRILVTSQAGGVSGGEMRGALLDLEGQRIGETFPVTRGVREYAITGTGDGFAIAAFGFDNTRVLRLNNAGGPVLPGGTLIEGPYERTASSYHSFSGAISSDGTDVAVIFTSGYADAATDLRTAIVGREGEIVRPARTILTAPPGLDSGILAVSVLWNGAEYVAALSIDLGLGGKGKEIDPALLRLSRTGEGLDAPATILGSPGSQRLEAMASNGREYMMTWGEDNSPTPFYLRIPRGSTTANESRELTRLVNPQWSLAIAGGRRDYLAAWIETDRNGSTVRASRIDSHGRYLDGSGIILATPARAATISVDSDGENWLVVWADGEVTGRRVSPNGVLLDPQPIAIAEGSQAVVRWGQGAWLVVSSTGAQLTSTRVGRNGTSATSTLIAQAPFGNGSPQNPKVALQNPALAFDGRQFVVTVSRNTVVFIDEFQLGDTSILMGTLDVNGNGVTGSTVTVAPQASSSPTGLATNGSQRLITYSTGFNVFGTLMNEGSASAPLTIAMGGGSVTAAMWTGSEFLVAVSDSGPLRLLRISPEGTINRTLTMPADDNEHAFIQAFPPSLPAESTAGPISPALAFVTQHDAYDAVPRAAFAFINDIEESVARPPIPASPALRSALRDSDGVTLTWTPQANALGFQIEMRQADGSDRVIGVAAGNASATHISSAGLSGSAFRLRAWNAAGMSAPSTIVEPMARRRAVGGR